MRLRFATLVASSAAFLATFAAAADARADCTNPLVSSCINSENYWPNPGIMRFATVPGTETIARQQVAFGLVTSYIRRPIILHIASPGPDGSDQYVVNQQLNGNFLFAYGVTDRLQLDFTLPVTFIETGAGTSPLTGGDDLKDTAVRDLRFGLTFAIVPRDRVSPDSIDTKTGPGKNWSLTGRLGVTAPSGDSSDFAGERTAVFVPSISADYRIKAFFFGASLGARIRPITEFAGARIGTQLTTAAGAGIDIIDRDRLAFMLEGRIDPNFAEQHTTSQSAFGITSAPNGKSILPAEWFAGVRTSPFLAGDVSFLFGGGGPIPIGEEKAITIPRYRFVLGITYAPQGRDTDGDGLLDRDDMCPNEAGPRSGDRPGCPGSVAPPPPETQLPVPQPPPVYEPTPAPAPAEAPKPEEPKPDAPKPEGNQP